MINSIATPWNTFYTGTQDEINAAIDQINSNCGFPDEYCSTWDVTTQAYEQNFWFCMMPPPEGYKEPNKFFSQSTMIANVVNVTQQQSQPNWWPPPPG